jgi:5-hydroxyisourate hydrolase
MSNLTTHVLDAALGRPAVGVHVRLESADGTELVSGRTNDDGRVPGLVAEPLVVGDYRLVFDTGGYHRATGQTGFYPEVAITFRVSDPQEHHHVPLLLAPFAYSTYRGS